MKTIKTVTLSLLLLLSSASALAQSGGGCYAGTVIAPPQPFGLGQPSPGAIVRICSSTATGTPCSPLTPGGLFSDTTLLNPISNPFTADQNGNYNFCASNGNYLVQTFPQTGTTYSSVVTVGIAPSGSYTFSGNNTFSGINTFTANNIFGTPQTFTEGVCSGTLTGSDAICANSALHALEVSLNNGSFVPIPQLAGDLGGTAASPTVTSTHITGGTVNTMPRFNASGNIVPSACTDNGSTIACTEPISSTGGISGTTGTFTGAVSGSSGAFTGAVSGASGSFTTSTLGTASATQITNTGDTLLSSGKVVSWNGDVGFSRTLSGVLGLGNGTQGDVSGQLRVTTVGMGASGLITQGSIANLVGISSGGAAGTLAIGSGVLGDASGTLKVAAINNAVLQGAGSGNSVTLLNTQGPLGALTGNAADQTVYTYTIPANTIQAGKGIRITAVSKHTTGNGAITYKLKLGATTLDSNAITGNANIGTDDWTYRLFNNSGVQNAQNFTRLVEFTSGASTAFSANNGTSAENTANALALTYTFNAANTEQVTPVQFIVELIQ